MIFILKINTIKGRLLGERVLMPFSWKNIMRILLATGIGMCITGCLAGTHVGENSNEIHRTSLVFGIMKVTTIGPNPRAAQPEIRFIDVYRVDNQERIRVDIHPAEEVFFLNLIPGDYLVTRLEIHEEWFTTEARPQIQFHIPDTPLVSVGIWHFEVDTPRTQRMVRLTITKELPELKQAINSLPILKGTPLMVALPKPLGEPFRLFSVAPYPKASYFYRR